jgi:hypothetical protein
LCGLELFDATGQRLTLSVATDGSASAGAPAGGAVGRLSASPASINVLPEVAAAGGDPRTLDKLVDGVVDTADAEHMWLTPWPGTCPFVFLPLVAVVLILP